MSTDDVKRYQSDEIVRSFSQGTARGPYILASDHDAAIAASKAWDNKRIEHIDLLQETIATLRAEIAELEAINGETSHERCDLRDAYEAVNEDLATAQAENAKLFDREIEMMRACMKIGKWLSAAQQDTNVCNEMKADIETFFDTIGIIEDGEALKETKP